MRSIKTKNNVSAVLENLNSRRLFQTRKRLKKSLYHKKGYSSESKCQPEEYAVEKTEGYERAALETGLSGVSNRAGFYMRLHQETQKRKQRGQRSAGEKLNVGAPKESGAPSFNVGETHKSIKTKSANTLQNIESLTHQKEAVNEGRRIFISSRRAEHLMRNGKSLITVRTIPNTNRNKKEKRISAAVRNTVRAIIDKAKNLYALLAAGGSTILIPIVIICAIGIIVASPFAIFFSSEDTGSEKTMQTVIRETNNEYNDRIKQIKEQNPHDSVELSGSSAVWRDVLSIYAVRANMDPEDPQEVASLDDAKIRILKEVFWDMNKISYNTETKTEIVISETADEEGKIIVEENEADKVVIYISISHKTAEEIATQYGFDGYQKGRVSELLDEENQSLWAAVLYGIHYEDTAILEVAKSQIGNVGGEPYWSWYGFNSRVEWCSCFVSWCANECGYIENGIVPKHAECNVAVRWFKKRNQWVNGNAEPVPGMLVFFDWDNKGGSGNQNGTADHIGIVEKVENGCVYTIEGNASDCVARRKYTVGHYEILGYGMPFY